MSFQISQGEFFFIISQKQTFLIHVQQIIQLAWPAVIAAGRYRHEQP